MDDYVSQILSKSLEGAATRWSHWMLENSWQVAVVVLFASLTSWVFRRRSTAIVYAVWMLVLVRLVLPPDFAFPTGWGWWLRAPAVASISVPVDPVAKAAPRDARSPVPTREDSVPRLSSRSTSRGSLSWSMLMMLAWIGIVGARLGMLFSSFLQVRVWVTRAAPILDDDVQAILQEARAAVGVRRSVDLRNSEGCSTPLVIGWFRPVILLPSVVLQRLSPDELKTVLIHELSHVRRGDLFVNMVQAVLGCFTSFIPWYGTQIIKSAGPGKTLAMRQLCAPATVTESRMAARLSKLPKYLATQNPRWPWAFWTPAAQ